MYPKKSLCPCCKFSTLDENGVFEICIICWWEDDGQNNANADIVLGGPNGEYSLLDARKNFSLHGHMYNEYEGIREVEKPSVHRKALISLIEKNKYSHVGLSSAKIREILKLEDEYLKDEKN